MRHRRAWWWKKRDLKHVFYEELREARRILKDGPKLAVHDMRQGRESMRYPHETSRRGISLRG